MNPGSILMALGRAALEGGAFLLLLWLVTRLWPAMPAGARRWLWWLGSLRLLTGLVSIPRFTIDWAPRWEPVESATDRLTAIGDALATPVHATPQATWRPPMNVIELMLVAIWVAGVALGLVLMARRLVRLRRRWRAAVPFVDPRAAAWRAEWAVALGRNRLPEIRVGADTEVPLAVGLWRPGILLQRNAERLSDNALRLVLAHEMSHLRRRDPLLGWVPAAAEIFFWFHPLVRLAAREYLAAREELCDRDALRATHASPADYGALLLDFAVGHHSILPGAASCGTPAGRHLKRRLHMLSNHTNSPAARVLATALFALFLGAGFAPVRLEANDLTMHGNQRVNPDKPSRVVYMLKTAGRKGTRGSVDIPFDVGAAKDLDRWDQDALYFRFGEERWITRDREAIRSARRALQIEEQFAAGHAPADRRREELDRDLDRLESRYEALQNRKDDLEDRRSELQDTAKLEQLERDRAELERRLSELAREKNEIAKTLDRFEATERASEAEHERLSQQTLREMERIGRRAIQQGVAERYRSRGDRS